MKTSSAWATLFTCLDRRTKWLVAIVYALCAAGALLVLLVTHHEQNIELGAIVPLFIGAAFVWSYGASGGLALMQDARALRMPSIVGPVLSALLLLFIATVLVPAALLRLHGGDFMLFSALLACAAFAALLWTLLPRALAFVPSIVLIFGHLDRLVPRLRPHDPYVTTVAWALALLLAALAAWRWLNLQRQESGPLTWGSPVFMSLRQQMRVQVDARNVNANIPLTDLFSGLRATGSVDGLGPQRPVIAMRAWLGSLFAPQNWRQRATGLGIQLAYLLVMILLITRLGEAKEIYLLLGLFVSGMLGMTFQLRLRFLYQRHGGELSELALLPGWGDAQHARRILLSAVFRPLAVGLFGLWLLVVLLAFRLDVRAAAYLIILCVIFGVASNWLAFCLRALAGLPGSFLVVLPLVSFALALLFTGYALLTADSGNAFHAGTLWKVVVAWLVVVALMCLLALHAYRRFVARPHPFLAE